MNRTLFRLFDLFCPGAASVPGLSYLKGVMDHVFAADVYIAALGLELETATDPAHKADVLAELARMGVRSRAVAPKRESR
jgi:hypothetical protein